MAQLDATSNDFMYETRTNLRNQAAQIHDLEMRMGQMVEVLTTSPLGALPEIIEALPQQPCHDSTLRSGEEVTQIAELEESSTGDLLQQEQSRLIEAEITQPPKQEEYLSVPNGKLKSKVEGEEATVQVFSSLNYIA